ncbi:MAG: agmatine deiminase family protein [Pseudomonadota bacterium]|nr:agmatine deiminase family protein [Pseudomonadota bacterium]
MPTPSIVPAEWAPHKAIWTAWPTTADLWFDELEAVRAEVAAMVKALSSGDHVRVLACGVDVVSSARQMLGGAAEIIPFDYGDIWLRDTGPVFSRRAADNTIQAEVFDFNGWGEKYLMPPDDEVAQKLAALAGASTRKHAFILEGGAIDADGEGTVLTTRQCLLNPNRNKGWTVAEAEAGLLDAYGARKVIWLGDGLLNDHTDGHVDNIARFVGPGRVVCQAPNGPDDPNAATLLAIEASLREATDAKGRKLEVLTVPSPGLLTTPGGDPIPASHMNFVIGNKTVVVPTYNECGEEAVAALQGIFRAHDVIGLSARAILTAGGDAPGGGAFHCMTQQEPA